MKVIHSADWQLGARFAQFGDKADLLRRARLTTLERGLQMARDRFVDAFVVAGDLFEDNQVEEGIVSAVMDLFARFSTVPIYLLPGNHDPFTGPDSIWNRPQFQKAPSHIHVFRAPGVVKVGDGYLVASPLQQKVSTVDPSLKLVGLARSIPEGAIKLGFTHGAPAIPGKHQPNDFPIHLEAATRAGLDYLGIGHWHNWQVYDNGRMVMPGTPEPDQFDQEGAGYVALVEIAERLKPPTIEKIPVATLAWRSVEIDLLTAANSPEFYEQQIAAVADATSNNCVLRVVLSGSASPQVLESVRAKLHEKLSSFQVSQVVDRSTIAISEMEIQQLQLEHPFLAQVLADLAQLDHVIAGTPKAASVDGVQPISLAEAQRLAVEAKIDLTALTAHHFKLARQLLFEKLREVQG